MLIRLFHNPFWHGDRGKGLSTLAGQLERIGVSAEQAAATASALGTGEEAQFECPESADLRALAEDIPNLTVEIVD